MPRKYSSTRSNAARKVAAAMGDSPCTICGRIVLVAVHQWQADHITPRAVAEAHGWTSTEIDSPTNIGLAHKSCNESAGTKLGNQLRAQAKTAPRPRRVPQIQRPQLSFSSGHEESPAGALHNLSPNAAQESQDGF